MADLTLFSFIVNNLIAASIRSAVIFHCWQSQDVKFLAQKVSDSLVYGQFADLNSIDENLGINLKNNFLKHKRPMFGVFMDMNCPKIQVILEGASEYRLYNDHYHWLLYDRYSNLSNFQLLFDHANVTINSDVTFAMPTTYSMPPSKDNSPKYFLQYDVYNNGPHIGGKLNMTKDRVMGCTISDCYVAHYLSDLHKRSKYGNRNEQRDINLRISTVISAKPLTLPEEEKIAFLMSADQPNIESIARFGYQQAAILKDMLQCSFEHIWTNSWSLNETYGGLAGDLINDASDIISSNMAMSVIRRPTMIPVVESSTFHSICMFRTPRKTGLRNTGEVYLDPFSSAVWLMFAATIVIGALQLWGIFFVERYALSSDANDKPSFPSSLLISFGTVCAQGANNLPTTMSGRFAYTALDLASFIMFNYYTSVIVSTLLGAPVKSDIKTLAQLADSPLEVGFEPMPYNMVFLNTSPVPAVRRLVKKKIYSRKNPHTAFMPALEGIQRVRDRPGTFAYVFEASTGYSVVERYYEQDEICDLNEISLRPEQNLYFIMNKNSSYVELMRLRLLRMIETGVNRRNVHFFLRNQLYCFPTNTIWTVGIENTAALFFLLLTSFVLATFVMLLEIAWHKTQFLKLKKIKNKKKWEIEVAQSS